MANLIEMAVDIVSAQASSKEMTKEELLSSIQEVHGALSALESGAAVATPETTAPSPDEPAVSMRKAFGKNQIICMVCGKGFTTLKRHLKTAHDMTDKEYRDKFDIPKDKPLAATAYIESRRQMAIDRGLGENLAKARAAKKGIKK